MPAHLSDLATRTAIVVLTALAILAVALLLWAVAGVLILVFGAALLAILFKGLGNWIAARLGLSATVGLVGGIALVAAVVGTAVWLMGFQVSSQFDQLAIRMPQAWEQIKAFLQDHAWGRALIQQVEDARIGQFTGGVLQRFGSIAYALVGAVTDLLLVVAGGLYLAAQPGLYRKGLLALVPGSAKERAGRALDRSSVALRRWLEGQLISMSTVGALTGLGLWLLGVPSALALGLIAGLAEFIPIVGPLAAAVPGLMVAASEGGSTLLWVLALYILVQQVESNAIMPIVTRELVSLPPAVTLFAILAMGLLFGPLGVLFATPLTVLTYVLVSDLYVEGTLHRRAEVPDGD